MDHAYSCVIMLRVIQTKSAEGAKSYYSRSDYLSEGQELVGKWGGKGATMLGLSGTVDKQSFDRLCDNQDPRTGERLTLRTKANRSVGYDFNFHSPKGLSLAYFLNGDSRILDAFQESVEETMKDVEQDTITRVRKDGRMEERHTGNLVWGGFDHFTTREVDNEVDPHLHGHRMIFNVCWDSQENAMKAVQFRELKRDASFYEAAFHARLAARIKALGYDVERHGRDWDIAGINRKTIDKFSRRTLQIEALAEELGIEDAKEKDGLGAKSRTKKSYGKSLEELIDKWRKRMDQSEADALRQITGNAIGRGPVKPKSREAEAVAYAKLHCFERDSVVPKRKLLTEALRHGLGDVSVEEVLRETERQRIINRTMNGREWATSLEMLIEESDMLNWAREGKKSVAPLNDHWTVSRDWLNDDQKKAVQHILKSKDRCILVQGGAGTGKTTLMREAVEGIEAGGCKVLTFAPSAEASRGVLAKEGFHATTVAELLVNKELQASVRNNVIWIDEAGLLGTRTLKKVMDIAEREQSRLILSGDWRQHGSVEAGAAMRLLEQQAGLVPARVRKIQRQDGAYRETVALLAEGKAAEGLAALDRLGWVHEMDDVDERMNMIAKRYANGMDGGESVLAIAPTHAEADLLHASIRSELIRREIVDKTDHEILQLSPMRLTEAEKTDPQRISEGDVMVFHRKVKEIEKDARLDATPDNAKRFAKSAKQFEVFRKQSMRVAQGDMIRFTRNGKTKNGLHALHNGSVYRVKEFNKQGDFVLDNGWIVDRDYGFIGSGYTSTSHASQGKTVDRVLISESSMSYRAAGTEQFYVSVSRGRKQAEIFTDCREGLAEAIGKSDPRISATELLDDKTVERVQRQRWQQQNEHTQRERQKELVYERD